MNDESKFQLPEQQLWEAGGVTLPRAAEKFSEAAEKVHLTSAYDDTVFKGLSGGGVDSLKSEWTSLRNMIQDKVLVNTYSNLTNSGKALTVLAEIVAVQDTGNAAALNDAISDLNDDPVEGNRPPGNVPEPPSSDDPPPEKEK